MINPKTHKIDAIKALREFCNVTYGIDMGLKECKEFADMLALKVPEPYNADTFCREFPTAKLTGSRYFGNNTPLSDWDYFLADTHENDTKLVRAGFQVANNPQLYGDALTSSTWIKYLGNRNWIHVQLVTNPELKDRVQKYLNFMPDIFRSQFLNATKEVKRALWDWALLQVRKQA